jgi:hypothetical protein
MIKKDTYSEYVKPLLDALKDLRAYLTKNQDLKGADKAAEAAAWISNNWYENFCFEALEETRENLKGNITADDILSSAFTWEYCGRGEGFWADIFDALFEFRREATKTPSIDAHSSLSESTLSDAIAELKTNTETLTVDASNVDVPNKILFEKLHGALHKYESARSYWSDIPVADKVDAGLPEYMENLFDDIMEYLKPFCISFLDTYKDKKISADDAYKTFCERIKKG